MEKSDLRIWFDNNFLILRKHGHDPDHTFKLFVETITNEQNPETGLIITKEELVDKYSKYLLYKNSIQKQYVSIKEKEIYSIYDYLFNKKWKEEYNIHPQETPERDDYLFSINY